MSTDFGPISAPVSQPAVPAEAPKARNAAAQDSDGQERAPTKSQRAREEPLRPQAQALFDQLTQGVLREHARVSFERDADTNKIVIKVIDEDAGEVVRQWPMEDALELARRVQALEGQFVDERI